MTSAGHSRSADFRAIKETKLKIEKEKDLERLKTENLRCEIKEERLKHQKEIT
jgi:hypothetical protein